MLAAELCSRQSVVSVSWVKGHAKQIDVDRGRVTKEDKTGNDGADALAVAGACLHQVPAELSTSACERKELAVNVQRMMIKILQARAEAESNSLDDAVDVDRGSEMGDCMSELLNDELGFDNGVDIQCDAP